MKRLIVPVICAASLAVLPSGTASAEDKRDCVGKAEFNSLSYQRTKSDIEERWEVERKGQVSRIPGFGTATLYSRCGRVKQFPNEFYGVVYQLRDGQWWSIAVIWS